MTTSTNVGGSSTEQRYHPADDALIDHHAHIWELADEHTGIGFSDALRHALRGVWDIAHTEGHEAGHGLGYDQGYDKGYEDAETSIREELADQMGDPQGLDIIARFVQSALDSNPDLTRYLSAWEESIIRRFAHQ